MLYPPLGYSQVLEQTFSEDIADFKISTPNQHWKFAPRSLSPGLIRAQIRFETSVERFIPNTTVQVMAQTEKGLKLDQWIEKDLETLPESVKVEKKSPIEHQGYRGYEILLQDKKSNLKFQQWIFLAKGKSFVITCAAKTSTFPRFEEEFKKILNSFEIL